MSKSTTLGSLEAIVERINRMMKTPLQQYVRTDTGKLVGQIGNFHLDRAYGGFALYQMTGDSGGCNDVLSIGHVSKGTLESAMFAFIRGIELAEKHYSVGYWAPAPDTNVEGTRAHDSAMKQLEL
jgi:hypothetical protein